MNKPRTTKSRLVTVEYMPDYLKSSHRAARNWGTYPHNGAIREKLSRDDAQAIIDADDDCYAHIV